MIFVDVGQGDGAVLITPERGQRERIVVIDAGEHQNMGDFLNGRFGSYRTGFQFHAAVITHPDEDHYGGFKDIFEAADPVTGNHKIGFDVLYQCGLIERPQGSSFERIGGLNPAEYKRGRTQYVESLATTKADIVEAFGDAGSNERKPFAETMEAALANPNIGKYKMLSTAHGASEDGKRYMPEFAPSDNRGYTIEVLGPVVERIDGTNKLRRLGSYGETKNGHSVILRLEMGDFSVLFGGDLNIPAEKWLLSHYSGLDKFPDKGTYEDMITDASRTFRADVMKVCHHGSEKVTDAFLRAVNPAAFIISSGDQEGHAHPRQTYLAASESPAGVTLLFFLRQNFNARLEPEKKNQSYAKLSAT